MAKPTPNNSSKNNPLGNRNPLIELARSRTSAGPMRNRRNRRSNRGTELRKAIAGY